MSRTAHGRGYWARTRHLDREYLNKPAQPPSITEQLAPSPEPDFIFENKFTPDDKLPNIPLIIRIDHTTNRLRYAGTR